MRRNLYIKFALSFFAGIVLVITASTQFKLNSLASAPSADLAKNLVFNELKTKSPESSDMEKAPSSSYFSVFKFITGFISSK